MIGVRADDFTKLYFILTGHPTRPLTPDQVGRLGPTA
jgi:hypothetical protein